MELAEESGGLPSSLLEVFGVSLTISLSYLNRFSKARHRGCVRLGLKAIRACRLGQDGVLSTPLYTTMQPKRLCLRCALTDSMSLSGLALVQLASVKPRRGWSLRRLHGLADRWRFLWDFRMFFSKFLYTSRDHGCRKPCRFC